MVVDNKLDWEASYPATTGKENGASLAVLLKKFKVWRLALLWWTNGAPLPPRSTGSWVAVSIRLCGTFWPTTKRFGKTIGFSELRIVGLEGEPSPKKIPPWGVNPLNIFTFCLQAEGEFIKPISLVSTIKQTWKCAFQLQYLIKILNFEYLHHHRYGVGKICGFYWKQL